MTQAFQDGANLNASRGERTTHKFTHTQSLKRPLMHILTTRYTSHTATVTRRPTYTHIRTFTLTEGKPTGQGSHTYSHSLIGMDWSPGPQKHIGSLETPGRRQKCVCKAQEEWKMEGGGGRQMEMG